MEARQSLHRITPELLAVHQRFRESRPVHAVRAVLVLAEVLTGLGPADLVASLLDDAVALAALRSFDLRGRALLARGVAREFMGGLDAAALALGDIHLASEHLREAIVVLEGVGQVRLAALRWVMIGMLAALAGDANAAMTHFVQARRALETGEAPTLVAAIDVLDGFVELARGGEGNAPRARAHLALGGDPPPLDVRVVRRLLEVAIRL